MMNETPSHESDRSSCLQSLVIVEAGARLPSWPPFDQLRGGVSRATHGSETTELRATPIELAQHRSESLEVFRHRVAELLSGSCGPLVVHYVTNTTSSAEMIVQRTRLVSSLVKAARQRPSALLVVVADGAPTVRRSIARLTAHVASAVEELSQISIRFRAQSAALGSLAEGPLKKAV